MGSALLSLLGTQAFVDIWHCIVCDRPEIVLVQSRMWKALAGDTHPTLTSICPSPIQLLQLGNKGKRPHQMTLLVLNKLYNKQLKMTTHEVNTLKCLMQIITITQCKRHVCSQNNTAFLVSCHMQGYLPLTPTSSGSLQCVCLFSGETERKRMYSSFQTVLEQLAPICDNHQPQLPSHSLSSMLLFLI